MITSDLITSVLTAAYYSPYEQTIEKIEEELLAEAEETEEDGTEETEETETDSTVLASLYSLTQKLNITGQLIDLLV